MLLWIFLVYRILQDWLQSCRHGEKFSTSTTSHRVHPLSRRSPRRQPNFSMSRRCCRRRQVLESIRVIEIDKFCSTSSLDFRRSAHLSCEFPSLPLFLYSEDTVIFKYGVGEGLTLFILHYLTLCVHYFLELLIHGYLGIHY